MKKLLLVLLVLVLGLPSVASAVKPSGTLVVVPDSEADGGAGPAPKSWLFDDIFVVRAHVCRVLGVLLCGPDPLVSSGASFSGVVRIWVPFLDSYTIYLVASDAEGHVMSLQSGTFAIGAGVYFNVLATFAPLPSDLYKFHVLVIGNGSGLITFSEFYRFRVGGLGSGGCCP